MAFVGSLSQNMLFRHENVQMEVQLPQNWRVDALGFLYSF